MDVVKSIPSKYSNHGFSLIEIIVGMGLLSILALALAQMSTDAARLQKTTDVNFGVQNGLNILAMTFKSSAQCKPNISNFSSANLTTANAATFSSTVSKWDRTNFPASTTTSMIVDNGAFPGIPGTTVRLSIGEFSSIGSNIYVGKAIFHIERENALGGQIKDRILGINVVTDGTTITDCSFSENIDGTSATELLRQETCTMLGGTYTPGSPGSCSMAAVNDAIKSSMCTSLGGTYSTSTGNCSLASVLGTIGTCSTTQYAVGVSPTGGVLCAALPAPAPGPGPGPAPAPAPAPGPAPAPAPSPSPCTQTLTVTGIDTGSTYTLSGSGQTCQPPGTSVAYKKYDVNYTGTSILLSSGVLGNVLSDGTIPTYSASVLICDPGNYPCKKKVILNASSASSTWTAPSYRTDMTLSISCIKNSSTRSINCTASAGGTDASPKTGSWQAVTGFSGTYCSGSLSCSWGPGIPNGSYSVKGVMSNSVGNTVYSNIYSVTFP